VAVLSLPSGVAFASHIGGGAPNPHVKTVFKGADSAGAVTFALWSARAPLGLQPSYIANFKFANPCAPTGTTTVTANIKVTSKLHFAYRAHGISIAGALGPKHAHSRGTASIVTSACSSGPLSFTAHTG
jgi:hypothetical protein